MSILNDSDLQAIRQSVQQVAGTNLEVPRPFRLGDKRNPPTVRVENEPGMVYAYPADGTGDSIPIVNSLPDEQLIYGTYVLVVPYKETFRIVSLAPEDRYYSDGVAVRPQRAVTLSQINNGLLRPLEPAGMKVQVTPGIFGVAGTMYHLGITLLSKSFTADVPATAGQSVAIRIDLDPAAKALSYTSGSEFAMTSHSGDFANYPADVPDTRICVGWVRLTNGMTSITRDEILTGLEVVSKSGSASAIDAVNDLYWNRDGRSTYVFASIGEPVRKRAT